MINEEINIVENVCIWDGNTETWQPPSGYLVIPQATTPAKIWELNPEQTEYVLVEVIGAGQLGFTWDGTYAITNEPQPVPPVQPTTSGTQTL